MTFVPCKAADLKEGDRVRVTLEGVVKALPCGLDAVPRVSIRFVGDEVSWNNVPHTALDAGELERQERPLQVGDRVKRTGWDAALFVQFLRNEWAVVEDREGTMMFVPARELERVS